VPTTRKNRENANRSDGQEVKKLPQDVTKVKPRTSKDLDTFVVEQQMFNRLARASIPSKLEVIPGNKKKAE
jgi:hypothetical protein